MKPLYSDTTVIAKYEWKVVHKSTKPQFSHLLGEAFKWINNKRYESTED